MKSVLFRVPEDIEEDFEVELLWRGLAGQKFIEQIVRESINNTRISPEVNLRGERRADIRRRCETKLRGPQKSYKLRKKSKATTTREASST